MKYSKKYIWCNFIARSSLYVVVAFLISFFCFENGENDELLFSNFLGIDTALEFLLALFIGLIIFLSVLLLICYWSWKKITYSFDESEAIFEKGIIFKRKIAVSYDKMHGIIIERTLLMRIFGLSKLLVNSGNASSNIDEIIIIDEKEIILAIEEELNEKKKLLKEKRIKEKASKMILPTEVKEHNEKTLDIKFDRKMRKEYTFNLFSLWVFYGVFTCIYLFSAVMFFLQYGFTLSSVFISLGILIALLWIVRLLTGLAYYLKYYHYRVVVDDKKIIVTYGFFTINKSIIAKNKVKALIVTQNIVQRRTGYASIFARVIGLNNADGDENEKKRDVVIAFFKIDEVDKYLRFLDEDFKLGEIDHFTRKDSFKFYIILPYIIASFCFIPIILGFIYTWISLVFLGIYIITILLIILLRRIQYHNQGIGYDEDNVYVRNGCLTRSIHIIKWNNVVRLCTHSTPWRLKSGIISIVVCYFTMSTKTAIEVLMMDQKYYAELTLKLKR